MATNALRYNTNKSVWQELTLKFDAALLKQGENEMRSPCPPAKSRPASCTTTCGWSSKKTKPEQQGSGVLLP